MTRRKSNGEGSIYRHKDGRWVGALYVLTTSGIRKRLRVYGKTRAEAHAKLTEVKARQQQGIAIPDKSWRLRDYLDYWLENVAQRTVRPTTFERYSINVRLYLKPALGHYRLDQLSVSLVQAFLNQHLAAGHSVRSAQVCRTTLSSALTSAQREEYVMRNVARLVKLPTYESEEIVPWTKEEIRLFLRAARKDALFAAFLLLTLYGLRRGEVLGLRWQDIDFKQSSVHVRQQILRIDGALQVGPVKTKAGRRDLPLVPLAQDALLVRQAEQGTPPGSDLVFTTRSGTPVEPQNLARSFWRICTANSIRRIRLHDLRHTTATMLSVLGVPARSAQQILGHSHVSVTQQIYQHSTMTQKREAVSQLESILRGDASAHEDSQDDTPGYRSIVSDGSYCRQVSRQTHNLAVELMNIISGSSDRDRTCDLRLMRGNPARLIDRATSVIYAQRACTRKRILGVVAVNLAVKIESSEDGEQAA